MDGLILAAGFGSRLRELYPSKPLALVKGVSLLEISIRQLVSAGATRVVVVTGYQADLIETALVAIRGRVDCEIITKRINNWDKPNGYSVMAGASVLPDNYMLVMCDHLLSTPILRGLAEIQSDDRGVTLAIDRKTKSTLVDPDDATWVARRDDGFINRIGKGLATYDAVDCGAFHATPALAYAIQQSIDAGKPGSLSDGMQWLADRGQAATLDIGSAWWMDVDDPRAHAMAEQLLDERLSLLGSSLVVPAPQEELVVPA